MKFFDLEMDCDLCKVNFAKKKKPSRSISYEDPNIGNDGHGTCTLHYSNGYDQTTCGLNSEQGSNIDIGPYSF